MIATGQEDPLRPYFFIHEYKPSKRADEPLGQVLAAMVAAQAHNADEMPVLGCFVIRPILSANSSNALKGGSGVLALPNSYDSASNQALNGEIDDGYLPSIACLGDSGGSQDEERDPVSRLRRLIEERQSESVEILRGWMEYDEGTR